MKVGESNRNSVLAWFSIFPRHLLPGPGVCTSTDVLVNSRDVQSLACFSCLWILWKLLRPEPRAEDTAESTSRAESVLPKLAWKAQSVPWWAPCRGGRSALWGGVCVMWWLAVCQGAVPSDNWLTFKLDQHVTSRIYRQKRVMTVNGKLAASLLCKYLSDWEHTLISITCW